MATTITALTGAQPVSGDTFPFDNAAGTTTRKATLFQIALGAMSSGQVVSGYYASGSIASGHFASGFVAALNTTILTSGSVTSGLLGNASIVSGSIASGQIFTLHIASGGLLSGAIGSGQIGNNHLSSGAIVSGRVASGQIGFGHLADGSVQSGTVASGQIFTLHVASGGLLSGAFGSGQISRFAVASGSLLGFELGSGAIVSGRIASGQVGFGHLANQSVLSGTIGSGQVASGHCASGFLSNIVATITSLTGQQPVSGDVFPFDTAAGTGTFKSTLYQLSLGILIGNSIRSGMIGGGSVSSGSIQSGAVVGQVDQSGDAWNIASGTVWTYDIASGAAITLAQYAAPYVSGTSWSINTEEIISGVRAVAISQSGKLRIAMASVSGRMPAVGIVKDGVLSGIPANVYTAGSLQFTSGMADYSGFLGTPIYVGRSGQIVTMSGSWNSGGLLSGDTLQSLGTPTNSGGVLLKVDDQSVSGSVLGSGVVLSGNIASGQLGRFHIGSGQLAGFELGSGAIVSGRVASGQIGFGHLADGSVQSGVVASGQVFTLHIASGGLLSGALGSGQIGNTHLGSGAVLSGHIASGQVGNIHISSGAVTSGRLGVTGTPDGTLFLRDDFTWQAAGGAVGSGAIGSGKVASGAVQGFYGTTRHIASGTVGGTDLGSGAVQAGIIGSGAVISGNIASGQLGRFHSASGVLFPSAQWLADDAYACIEAISGGRAVAFTQSGFLQIAMAGTSGRMPAVGVTALNYASGDVVTLYRNGRLYSTLYNFSGWMNQPLWVGVSGDVIASGAPAASGNVQQMVGTSVSISGLMLNLGDPMVGAFILSGSIGSGAIAGTLGGGYFAVASGTLGTYDLGSGTIVRAANFIEPLASGTGWSIVTEEIISGVRAVQLSQSGTVRVAMASVSGRMPAFGIVTENILSGMPANVYTQGLHRLTSGMADFSGWIGRAVWVGRSGQIVQWSGSWNSGGLSLVSGGDFIQRLGVVATSGAIISNVNLDSSQDQSNFAADGLYDSASRNFGF